MLRQAINIVDIEGILSETKLEDRVITKNGMTRKAIGGSINVRVPKDDQTLEIPVTFFAYELKNDGNPNPAYAGLRDLKENFISIAAGGIDKADCVRINNANITMNEYYSKNSGKLVSFPRIRGSFVNKVSKEAMNPTATFDCEFVIGKMFTDDDNIMHIDAVLPQYGGTVDIVPFITANANVANAIEQKWTVNDSVRAHGELLFTSITEKIQSDDDDNFGTEMVRERTVTISNLLITGGKSGPLDEIGFDLNEISTALAERKVRLEELKTKSTQPQPKSAPAKTADMLDLGF